MQTRLRKAGAHAGVDHAVTASVAGAVGFRNVLVHQYAEVDDQRVLATLALLPDLNRFVAELAAWATTHRETGGDVRKSARRG